VLPVLALRRRDEYSPARQPLARTNCFRIVISCGVRGSFLGFFDQIQRGFDVLAAQQLVFLAFKVVIVHEEGLKLGDEWIGQVA
jgi:hypothetical protein